MENILVAKMGVGSHQKPGGIHHDGWNGKYAGDAHEA